MYNWNIDDLKKLLHKYRKKAISTTDENLRAEYECTANNILEIIENYNEMVNPSNKHRSSIIVPNAHIDVIRDDIIKQRLYFSYFPLIKKFRDDMDGAIIELQDNLQKINTSQAKIVTVTTDFYHQFKGPFRETYDTLSSSFRNRLYFRKPNRNELYGGNTYSVYGTNEVFIETIKANTVQDYISLIHESSHGITCKLNQDIMWDWSKYCLIEVDSLFFEMIGTGYVSRINNVLEDGIKTKIATFKDHLYSADIICSKLEMYSKLSTKDLKNRRTVARFYKKEIGYDKTLTFDAMYSRIQEYMHYVISYLIAIELYMIFINDQDKALDLLYKIVMLKDLSNEGYLLRVRELGIEPGRNVQEYYKLLLSEENGVKYGKKIQYR